MLSLPPRAGPCTLDELIERNRRYPQLPQLRGHWHDGCRDLCNWLLDDSENLELPTVVASRACALSERAVHSAMVNPHTMRRMMREVKTHQAQHTPAPLTSSLWVKSSESPSSYSTRYPVVR